MNRCQPFDRYDTASVLPRLHVVDFLDAPLETIGDMTLSLRDLNRTASIACWSQGSADDWEVYGGRKRTSPTPEELRAQACPALAQRITSLYWFNLSLKSRLKFPDLIAPDRKPNQPMEPLIQTGF